MNTVLIIDDDPSYCRWCAEELGDDGYRTMFTSLGVKAMDLMRRHNPDLVILDIRLGEHSGLDLLQEIRHAKYDMPIILCSAYASFKCDLRSIAADHYVVKSADLDELKQKVKVSLQAYEPWSAAKPKSKQKAGHHGLQL